MINNNRVLIIKLSPVKGLDSSILRTLAVVKGLVKKGYIIDMLTLHNSATHAVNEKEYDFLKQVNLIYATPNMAYSSIVKGSNKGIKKQIVGLLRKVYHTFSLYDYTGSIAKRIRISLLPSTEYEFVIAVSDPKTSYLAAENLLKQGLKCNKLIEYWGDPLYGDITLKSIYPGFVYKKLEKRFLSFADKIVYTSPFTLKAEQSLYPSLKKKMIYTPTAYIEERILSKGVGKYTIGYYGAYQSNIRNILPLYEACSKMNDLVDLKIVGNSDLVLKNLSNIEVLPRGDITSFEEITDLFVCILNKRGAQIPGKLYHYAAFNRPILVIEDGDNIEEMHDFIESYHRYNTCKNDMKEIMCCIRQIIKENKQYSPIEEMSTEHVVSVMLN